MNAKEIFKTVLARCPDCNTPTDGSYKIGSEYYCHPDYELRLEKSANNLKRIEENRFKRFVNIRYD